MLSDDVKRQVRDLLNDNRVYYARLYNCRGLIRLKKTEFFEQINKVASLVGEDKELYLKEVDKLHKKLFDIVKLVREGQDLVHDIQDNLGIIRVLRYGTK